MTTDYKDQFKKLDDRMALEPISEPGLERRVLRHLWVIDDDTSPRARGNRERAIEQVLATFRGRGEAGDTAGNSPGTRWVAFLRDRRAPRLRPTLHDPHQPGAALLRGHRAQAARTRAGLRCLPRVGVGADNVRPCT